MEGQSSLRVLLLRSLGIRMEKGGHDCHGRPIKGGTMQGKPCILVVCHGTRGIGQEQLLYQLCRWLQDTGLVQGQKPQVAMEPLGHNKSSSLLRMRLGPTGRCRPILFQHQSKEHSPVFIIHLQFTRRLPRMLLQLQLQTATIIVVIGYGSKARRGDGAGRGGEWQGSEGPGGHLLLEGANGRANRLLVLGVGVLDEVDWKTALAILRL
eukprot:scaffold507355_cov59-Attheya_sp.AAC.1